MLYVNPNEALYGLLKSDLLFYKKSVAKLESLGFELNAYDPCVVNHMIKGKHQTVTWHLDDFKISHIDSSINN